MSAQIIARVTPGDSVENRHPPSFLQDVYHLPRFPGGTVAQIRPHLWPLPPRGCRGFPEFSSILHVFIEHLLYAKHCAGFLRECPLLPSWCLWQLLGWGGGLFKSGLLGRGSKHLLISPCCLQVLWEEGGVLRPRRNDLEIQWQFVQMTLLQISKSWCQRSLPFSAPCF